MKKKANTLTFKVEVDFDLEECLKDKTFEEMRVVVHNKLISRLKAETSDPSGVRISFVK